jgi:hypothetical protein
VDHGQFALSQNWRSFRLDYNAPELETHKYMSRLNGQGDYVQWEKEVY